jgi:hypothetical protein
MATSATEFIDNTTALAFIPEMWTTRAIIQRENALVYANLVDRRYEADLSMGDILNIPSVGNLAAQTKTINTAIVYETVTETVVQLTVATNTYSAIAVESITKVQSNVDQLKLYAGKMGYALGLDIDNTLAAFPDDNATPTVGTLASELTSDDYIRAIQYLDDADAPEEDRYFVVSPAEASGMVKKDRFVHNDYDKLHGSMPTRKHELAYVTSFLGVPIFKSVNVEGSNSAGHDNVLFQKEAYALIVQMKPKPWFMSDIDYFADKIALEQLHGSRINRADHSVWLQGA